MFKQVRAEPEQMTYPEMQDAESVHILFPEMEEGKSDYTYIISLLDATGAQYIDKHSNGGSFWIIGGQELADTVYNAKALGHTFHFKKGDWATKN